MEGSLSPFMEWLVLVVILGVVAAALLFFLMALIKRIKRLGKEQRKKEYQAVIERILFRYLFEEQDLKVVLEDPDFLKLQGETLFKKVAIKAIIALHDNYSGIYRKRLEVFFEESGLVNYSVGKLESSQWTHIVEGVRDLSTLNHNASYSRIASRIVYPNDLVKTEVLLGLIKMRGLGEILKFQKSGLQLNDWIQSNILYTVKKHKIPAPPNLEVMLQAKNKSIVLLTVRLINYYNTTEYYEMLSEFFQKTNDKKLKSEIAQVLQKTEYIS